MASRSILMRHASRSTPTCRTGRSSITASHARKQSCLLGWLDSRPQRRSASGHHCGRERSESRRLHPEPQSGEVGAAETDCGTAPRWIGREPAAAARSLRLEHAPPVRAGLDSQIGVLKSPDRCCNNWGHLIAPDVGFDYLDNAES